MKRSWDILPTVPESVVAELGLPRSQCQLLYNRGLTTRVAAQSFLSPDSSDSHDPWLMPDMDAAVGRLMRAIERSEPVGVFGDFDIDGISGTAVMTTALRELGANVVPYIPDRESEGHGLGLEAMRSMAGPGRIALGDGRLRAGPGSGPGRGEVARPWRSSLRIITSCRTISPTLSWRR